MAAACCAVKLVPQAATATRSASEAGKRDGEQVDVSFDQCQCGAGRYGIDVSPVLDEVSANVQRCGSTWDELDAHHPAQVREASDWELTQGCPTANDRSSAGQGQASASSKRAGSLSRRYVGLLA
jgi:hypothetical protein